MRSARSEIASSGPPSLATGQLPPRRLTGILLLVLGQSMQALALGGIALFLPLIRQDLDLTYTQAAWLSSANTIVYALMQIPAGVLADRFGARRLFLVGLLGTSLLTSSLAWISSYPLLVANQAAIGVFRALLFTPGLLLITSLFPPQRRATAMGVFVAAGMSSNVFLNTLGPALVGPLGWRVLFVAFSVGGVSVFLLLRRFGPKGAAGYGRQATSLREILGLFRFRLMWAVGAIQFVRYAVVQGIGFWLPTFIVLEKHQTLQMAGLTIAMGSLLSAPSNMLGGYVSDRLRSPVLVIGTSLGVLAVTTYLLQSVDSFPLFLLVVAVNYFFLQFYFGALFAVPIEALGPRMAGLTSGFGNLFANLGGFVSVLLLGAVRDRTGSFDLGLDLIAGLCVLGVGATLLLSRAKPPGNGRREEAGEAVFRIEGT